MTHGDGGLYYKVVLLCQLRRANIGSIICVGLGCQSDAESSTPTGQLSLSLRAIQPQVMIPAPDVSKPA